jgi:hypothetical protein
MTRYDLKYSEADMLDAFYAGRDSVFVAMLKSPCTPFDAWIEKRKAEAKELKDDEMRAEAQADGEQYEKELEESNNQI